MCLWDKKYIYTDHVKLHRNVEVYTSETFFKIWLNKIFIQNSSDFINLLYKNLRFHAYLVFTKPSALPKTTLDLRRVSFPHKSAKIIVYTPFSPVNKYNRILRKLTKILLLLPIILQQILQNLWPWAFWLKYITHWRDKYQNLCLSLEKASRCLISLYYYF